MTALFVCIFAKWDKFLFLTKDEEIDISKKIEFGEDIIIDAFCSVPYLIDFILDYKEALINRERRVKELFKPSKMTPMMVMMMKNLMR